MSSGLKIHSSISIDWKEKQPTMCNCRFTQWPHPSPFFAAQLLDVFKGRPALQTGGTGRGHAWADPDAPPSDERARSSGELSPRQEVAPQVARSQPRQRRPGAGTRPSPRVRTRPAASPSRPHSRPSPMSRRVWQPLFTPVLQENKTATGNQTPGCGCAGPAPRVSAHADLELRADPEGAAYGPRPPPDKSAGARTPFSSPFLSLWETLGLSLSGMESRKEATVHLLFGFVVTLLFILVSLCRGPTGQPPGVRSFFPPYGSQESNSGYSI